MSRRQKKKLSAGVVGGRYLQTFPGFLFFFLIGHAHTHARPGMHAGTKEGSHQTHSRLIDSAIGLFPRIQSRQRPGLKLPCGFQEDKKGERRRIEKKQDIKVPRIIPPPLSLSLVQKYRVCSLSGAILISELKKGRILIFCVFAMQMYKSPSAMHISQLNLREIREEPTKKFQELSKLVEHFLTNFPLRTEN